MLALERVAHGFARLRIDDGHRAPARGVARTASLVVGGAALFHVHRIAGVKRPVGAADDIDGWHGQQCTPNRLGPSYSKRSAKLRRWSRLPSITSAASLGSSVSRVSDVTSSPPGSSATTLSPVSDPIPESARR